MRSHSKFGWVLSALLLIASLAIAACGSDKKSSSSDTQTSAQKPGAIQSNSANKSVTITVGSKNFNENKTLAEIYAQAFKAAGYTVKTDLNLGDELTALKAIKTNTISGYPEYTGTILGSFLKVPSAKTPKDPLAAWQLGKAGLAKQGITVLPPTPFRNSNEVGLTRATDAKLGGITKISELSGKANKLTIYGSPECRQRQDCLAGLQDVYGLHFKKFTEVAIDLRHEVLQKGQADLSIVFTTDPQNSRDKLVLLKDDKGMFPPNNSTFILSDAVLKKAGPDLEKTVVALQKGLTNPVMSELNARTDLDKKTPKEVASEYLKETGLVQ